MSDSLETRSMEGQESDAALLARIQRGDEQALTSLFQKHSRLVFSVAMRVLSDREDAEDVLQEVFMQIWRRPLEIKETHASAGPLLAVMARNRAVDYIRKRRPMESVEDLPIASPHDVAAASEHTLLLNRVRDIASTLPPEQQAALNMAFFQGLTHTEIAETTGIPLGTIKTRIRTAVNLLERTLNA